MPEQTRIGPLEDRIAVIALLTERDPNHLDRALYRTDLSAGWKQLRTDRDYASLNEAVDKLQREREWSTYR